MATTTTTITYNVNDFPNKKVNRLTLKRELIDAGLNDVTDVNPTGTIVNLMFNGLISEADQSLITSVVDAHQGDPFSKGFQQLAAEQEQTESDGYWKEALEFDTGPISASMYQILWYSELKVENMIPGTCVEVSVILSDYMGVPVYEMSSSAWHLNKWHEFGGGAHLPIRDGESFKLKMYFKINGENVGYIRRVRFGLVPVGGAH